MKSTLPGAMRPDRSAAPLMPMAASGACATIEPSVSIRRMLRKPEQHARTFRRALQDRVVDLHMEIGELAVDRVLDHGHEARHGDRPVGKSAVAANDGDHADDEDAGEDLAAHMGAARRHIS